MRRFETKKANPAMKIMEMNMGLKMRQMEMPAALAATSSYVSPRLPNVMMDASRMESGSASGMMLAEKKNMSCPITSQLSPLPARSSMYSHTNCMSRMNI